MPILYGLAFPLYIVIFHIGRYRRNIAKKNIQNSFPHLTNTEQTSILKKFYKNFCQVIVEILKTIDLAPQQLEHHIHFENISELEQSLENNQTIILALAHQCNMGMASTGFKRKIRLAYRRHLQTLTPKMA